MSDIFNEVDEEVRKDAYKQLWQRYGRYALAAVVVLLVAAAAYTGWKDWQDSQARDRAQAFAETLDMAGSGQEAAAMDRFAELASGEDGYGILASLEEAKLRRRSGDVEGAIAIYDSVASDAAVGRSYRDLATVLSVMLQVDSGEPDALEARLQPLTAANEPYRFLALELSAIVALRDGRKEDAQRIYAELADDATAPQSLRARAAEMATALDA